MDIFQITKRGACRAISVIGPSKKDTQLQFLETRWLEKKQQRGGRWSLNFFCFFFRIFFALSLSLSLGHPSHTQIGYITTHTHTRSHTHTHTHTLTHSHTHSLTHTHYVLTLQAQQPKKNNDVVRLSVRWRPRWAELITKLAAAPIDVDDDDDDDDDDDVKLPLRRPARSTHSLQVEVKTRDRSLFLIAAAVFLSDTDSSFSGFHLKRIS